MDYSNDPEPNQHPNIHDYEELESIYEHLDLVTTLTQSQARSSEQLELENRSEWGKQIRNNGKSALFVRDFGKGKQTVTSIILAR